MCGLWPCLRVAKPRTNARTLASVSEGRRYLVFISALPAGVAPSQQITGRAQLVHLLHQVPVRHRLVGARFNRDRGWRPVIRAILFVARVICSPLENHHTAMPPSTLMSTPVTNELSSDALAMEGREYGIRANSISTGIIETSQSREQLNDKEWADNMLGKTRLGRLGKPEEVANVALFLLLTALASRASRHSEREASPIPYRWVVNFIQTPLGRWAHTCFDRAVVASRPGLQSNLSAGTHRVSVTSHRNTSGERKPHGIT
jgi:Enoyl-(Acyl carrier protein) reductase